MKTTKQGNTAVLLPHYGGPRAYVKDISALLPHTPLGNETSSSLGQRLCCQCSDLVIDVRFSEDGGPYAFGFEARCLIFYLVFGFGCTNDD